MLLSLGMLCGDTRGISSFPQQCYPAALRAAPSLGKKSLFLSEVAVAQLLPAACLSHAVCLANRMSECVSLFALAARELRVKFAAASNSPEGLMACILTTTLPLFCLLFFSLLFSSPPKNHAALCAFWKAPRILFCV